MTEKSDISVIQTEQMGKSDNYCNKNNCSENAKSYFKEYCQNSSIHGVKYVADNYNRSMCERVWWILSISTSLYLCIVLILKTYTKWENSPVIVSFATKETNIWQIPFPAITICPETKALPKRFNYTKYLKLKKQNITLNDEEEEKFGMISLICNYHKGIRFTNKFTGDEEKIFDFFNDVQPNFYEIISECKFMGEDEKCSDLFFPLITDEGICYTFNILDRTHLFRKNVLQYKNYHSMPISKWTLEHGYSSDDGKITYPKRALFAGATFALEAKLSVFDDELDFLCRSSMQGFKVQISHPSRMPRPRQQHFRIPLDQSIIAAMVLDMMTTSDAVKNYSPKRRNCYFPSERPLKYFKIYTQQNCQIECKTNYTLRKCGCINFYMPREDGVSLCISEKIHCIYEAEMELLNHKIEQTLGKLSSDTRYMKNCDCLPICTKMNYIIENSQSDWKWRNEYKNNTEKKHMSHFQIFFKANQFITSDRNELFGPIDFLANLGGLLGLFTGFSLLSLIEIIYYLSLRIICNTKIFGKENWAGKHQ